WNPRPLGRGEVKGDVCGKGIEAAKVTALARYTVRTEATQHARPAAILHRLHEAMVEQRVSDRFLTVALAVFRPVKGGVSGWYASAGHPPALIRRADGSVEEIHAPGTMLSPLLKPGTTRLGETRFRLHRGDAVLLYTDGITEARDGRGPLFGEDRLAVELAVTRGLGASDTLAHLRDQVRMHSGPYAADDTALMLLHVDTPTA
ncbi:PP2C family protein-serine/threonine phosphatase, partial [Actinoplanes couchii]